MLPNLSENKGHFDPSYNHKPCQLEIGGGGALWVGLWFVAADGTFLLVVC